VAHDQEAAMLLEENKIADVVEEEFEALGIVRELGRAIAENG
jgi:hypothetical protein